MWLEHLAKPAFFLALASIVISNWLRDLTLLREGENKDLSPEVFRRMSSVAASQNILVKSN